jgi:hypothetical protein
MYASTEMAGVEGTTPRVAFPVRVALRAAVAGTFATEIPEGDGVPAGFGQEVAAVAKHVRPQAEPRFAGYLPCTQLPRGGDHLPVVTGAAKAGDLDSVPDTDVGQARHGESLGGVLGDIVRDSLAVERLAAADDRGAVNGPGVGLHAEPEQDAAVRAEVSGDTDGGGLADGIAEQISGVPGGRRLVVLAGSIEADHGVEMDNAACLVLRDLDVPDTHCRAQLLAGDSGDPGQVTRQVSGEPAPQVTRVSVEHHSGGVVVAVTAHRLTEPGIIVHMPSRAGDITAMRAAAGVGVAAGTAWQHGLAAQAAGMDRAERRRGEGREHTRVGGDRFGDALATGQSRADELAGIAFVDSRAGRADGLTAVPAGDMEHASELAGSVVDAGDFSGGQVDSVDTAAQQDRVRALADSRELAFPLAEVGGCSRPRTLVRYGGGSRVRNGHQVIDLAWVVRLNSQPVSLHVVQSGTQGTRITWSQQ